MASPFNDFGLQTQAVIQCLFLDDCDDIETDSVDDSQHDDFNPMKIAAKLRELGDHYDETVIKPLIKDVHDAATDQVVNVFQESVRSLCRLWVPEGPELAPEKQVLRATVALALYVKKNCPDLTTTVKDAVGSIFNNQLQGWITQEGGWEASCS